MEAHGLEGAGLSPDKIDPSLFDALLLEKHPLVDDRVVLYQLQPAGAWRAAVGACERVGGEVMVRFSRTRAHFSWTPLSARLTV